ncbi:hypothetical protein JD844_016506 [Phrynosoma platyrhinos]|uniref:F-box domain-containing protein n=1 Tax=Phrynosoma platyrhinos TaxID=52577 RepID=A0ABQ7SKM9_PHRPL|nr:hypothetical protein JD844_016506 [Phrynosoma platyrhinos]
MATGRGWILRQHSLGALHRFPWESSSSKESAAMAAQLARIKKMNIRGQRSKSATVSNSVVNIDRMPSEVVMKIFSYLDAVSLLCVGCVNKRFYHLSSDKISGLRWVIILKDRNGKECVMDQEEISFNEISVTLFWYSIWWPCLETLSTLQLCGMTPVLLDKGKVHRKNGPWRRSLICEYELNNLTEQAEMIGCDGLIDLYRFDQGLLVGLWKKSGIAFVMASLHYHQLIERSILGSATMRHAEVPDKAILDDIDPEYGMHGYQLHIELQSRGNTYMCNTFRSLFCKKDFIKNGYLRITVISYKNHAQHLPLVGDVGLSWRVDAFEGNIQNCFIMDATILDDSQKPFWCVSAPVNMILSAKRSILYQYLGPKYDVNYVDCNGKIHMELVWMKETNEYYIVNLVLYLNTQKVNSWFGTNY